MTTKGVVKYERTADGKLKITQTDLKEFVYDLDGKPHPDPSRPGSMVTSTAVGDSEFSGVVMKNGEFQHSSTRKVSADGKTLTTQAKQRNDDGKVVGFTTTAKRISGEKAGFWGTWGNISTHPNEPSTLNLKISKDGQFSLLEEQPERFQVEARLDGNDYACTGTGISNMTVSVVRVSDSVLRYTFKQDGKPAFNGTWTLSADRRTITEDQKAPGSNDQISWTVYNRQR